MESSKEIVFPDLSYKIIGASFKVFNELGWGLPEKDYQIALGREFNELGILMYFTKEGVKYRRILNSQI